MTEPLKRDDWLTCPMRSSMADHWRTADENGRRTCLCFPEGFDPTTATPCGAVQPSGPGVCQVVLPGPHQHQALIPGTNTVVTWTANFEGAVDVDADL